MALTQFASAMERRPDQTQQVWAYFAPLTLLVYLALPHGFLVDIATSYMLKNQLHATATEVATFRVVTAIPVYLSVLFGFIRDVWNPCGLRDRGFFVIFAPLSGIVFLWMAFSRLSYFELLTGMLVVMSLFRLVAAAHQGLLGLVAQEKLMSGRLSALWLVVSSTPYVVGAVAAGYLTEHLTPRDTFIILVLLTLLIALMGLWKPRSVFNHAYDQPQAQGAGLFGDIKRLIKHRAIYPPILIMFLFQFSPGSNTPMQFYLTERVHASDAVYGYYYGIVYAACIVVYVFYGYLCKHVSLRKLLWWGTIISVPQMVPFAFVHSANLALLLAVPVGLMGGVAGAAYYDLAMRSCPAGLQGSLLMLVDGAYQLSYRGGDLLGSWMYGLSSTSGFLYCVLASTAFYVLILPLLLLIPKELVATADGEPYSQYAPQEVLSSATDR